jgi:hypothetical protein
MHLFDPFEGIFEEKLRKKLLSGWQGVFRYVILELMPVNTLAGHFDPRIGRPTKELYSMAGLLFIMEFMNWTVEEAVESYQYRMDIRFALNLDPACKDISSRTIERYRAHFLNDQVASNIMSEVTACLTEKLQINIARQRLDSTHVFSNMALFGRTRLMGIAVKQFLTQVKRHDDTMYASLSESLRRRYAPSKNRLFGDVGKDEESRRKLRIQVADDMHLLLTQFSRIPVHADRDTFKRMERIFYEQCEVKDSKVAVKEHPGGDILQHPSDPDATYDGHKGAGYQVQISETCHPDNEAQLITHGLPQTAVVSDSSSFVPVVHSLEEKGLKPEELLADTSYGGEDNYLHAQEHGIDLTAPIPPGSVSEKKRDPNKIELSEFEFDPATHKVTRCPAGHKPEYSRHWPERDTLSVKMGGVCGNCEKRKRCPVRCTLSGYYLLRKGKAYRLSHRKVYQRTEAFKEKYRVRGGIEATNSSLKRKLGLGRLRVRGRPAVFHAIVLRLAGWNIFRGAVCERMQEIVFEKAAQAFSRQLLSQFSRLFDHLNRRCSQILSFFCISLRYSESPRLNRISIPA